MKNDALNALIVDLVIENRGLKNQIKTWESLGVTQEMRIYELEDQLRDYKADDLVAKMAEDNEEVK